MIKNSINFFYATLLLVSFMHLGCKRERRNFFLNIEERNIFMDTFSLANIKGFGIGNESIEKNGETYYEFNINKNEIPLKGYISKRGKDLFFKNFAVSNEEYLFYSPSFKNVYKDNDIIKRNKDKSPTEIKFGGYKIDSLSNDSLLSISYKVKHAFDSSEPGEVIFFYNNENELIKFYFIDCKNDTLQINLTPTRNIFYKHEKSNVLCL